MCCPFCSGTRFRSRGRYRPLVGVKYVYAVCSTEGCGAHLKFKVRLEWARKPDQSPQTSASLPPVG